MKVDKIKKITIEALQARGYSQSEAQKFISQIAKNSNSNATETLPGSGIFCSEETQRQCVNSFKREITEYKRLWKTWMNRCHDLQKYIEDAVEPFNKKIKEINIYRDVDKRL